MQWESLENVEAVAGRAAEIIAADANAAVTERGRFVLALSRAPRELLHALAEQDVPWTSVHVLQVDERAAPAGTGERNLTDIADVLLSHTALVPPRLHPMPVEEDDLELGAAAYERTLGEVAGSPPVIDLLHLGLGPDGHTASLLPGHHVLEVADRDVAMTGAHQGWRRMTLTFPAINRARKILWIVTGDEKAAMVKRLLAGDQAIPAGRVRADDALLLTDCKV